jgi:hypothetical protein
METTKNNNIKMNISPGMFKHMQEREFIPADAKETDDLVWMIGETFSGLENLNYDAGDLMTRMRPNVEAILQSLAIDNPPSQSSRCIRAIEVYKDITEFHYSSDDNIDREMGLAFKIKDMSSTRFLRFLNSQKKLGRIRREMRHDIKILELFMALHEVCRVVESNSFDADTTPSESVCMTCDLSRTWKYENCVMVDGEIFEVPEQG